APQFESGQRQGHIRVISNGADGWIGVATQDGLSCWLTVRHIPATYDGFSSGDADFRCSNSTAPPPTTSMPPANPLRPPAQRVPAAAGVWQQYRADPSRSATVPATHPAV